MTPEIKELLERAKLSQKAAASLLRDDFASFAASRAYYSMFYIAQALLLSKGLSFSAIRRSLPRMEKSSPRQSSLVQSFIVY